MIDNLTQHFDYVNLEQSEKLYKNNYNRNSQHIHNRTDVHDLTNIMLQDESVAKTKQLLSSIAVPSCHYAIDQMKDIMSATGDSVANESSTCVGGEETTSTSNRASESFTRCIDTPDQPIPKSDLVTTNGNFDQEKGEVASPDEDDHDSDGYDTCENGTRNCLDTCYYCGVI